MKTGRGFENSHIRNQFLPNVYLGVGLASSHLESRKDLDRDNDVGGKIFKGNDEMDTCLPFLKWQNSTDGPLLYLDHYSIADVSFLH